MPKYSKNWKMQNFKKITKIAKFKKIQKITKIPKILKIQNEEYFDFTVKVQKNLLNFRIQTKERR